MTVRLFAFLIILMDSLKIYSRSSFLDDLQIRQAKIPTNLEPDALNRTFDQCLREFDTMVYLPRHILLKNAYNGMFVDVTDFHIDEITRVYYASDTSVTALTGEIGILPFISAQGGGIGLLDDLVDFFVIQRVLNGLRRYTNTFDYSLWPPDESGRVKLQVRNPGPFMIIEFLPWFDTESGVWQLYPKEKNFIDELLYIRTNLANTQSMAQAIMLGAPAKEAVSLVTYWQTQLDTVIQKWKDSAPIIGVL